jgi:hypothetical protein
VESKVSGAYLGYFIRLATLPVLDIGIKPPWKGTQLIETGFYIKNGKARGYAYVIRKQI